MRTIDTVRYVLAFLVLASHPPGILLWVAIHPFAASWRRLGPVWTYGLLSVPVAAYIVAVWHLRHWLLRVDFGFSLVTTVFAVVCLVVGYLLNRARRKHLSFGTLSGIPELSKQKYPGALLTEGIYGRLRHPRYVEVCFWVSGYALFANYLTTYLVVLLSFPVLFVVVLMEERELRERFGEEYEAYCQRVPRFFPRRSSGKRR